MTIIGGIRHKDYVVYVEKEQNETNNSYIQRLWFIVKNITKNTYDELVLNSWFFVNINFNNITYTQDIQQTLENYNQ
tara:strand:- start:13 stop:243 length:231 start_codon:yes stop_codon:yes gene_type:complete